MDVCLFLFSAVSLLLRECIDYWMISLWRIPPYDVIFTFYVKMTSHLEKFHILVWIKSTVALTGDSWENLQLTTYNDIFYYYYFNNSLWLWCTYMRDISLGFELLIIVIVVVVIIGGVKNVVERYHLPIINSSFWFWIRFRQRISVLVGFRQRISG